MEDLLETVFWSCWIVGTVPLMEDLLKSVGLEKDDVGTVAGVLTLLSVDTVGCVRMEDEDLEELGRPCK